MLLDISAKADSFNILQWKIPRLSLDRRFNYRVGVRHLNFSFMDKSQDFGLNELLSLSSNIVDLSIRNPLQSLLTFGYDVSPVKNLKPSIVSYYPVQLYELEDATFSVRSYFDEKEIKLKHIFINLEILRVDPYGRI